MSPLLVGIILTCLVPTLLFVVSYARLRWWTNPAGQAVMILSVAALVSFSLSLARAVGYPAPGWLRYGSYALIAGALWWQYISFLRIRSRGRRRVRQQRQLELELQPEV